MWWKLKAISLVLGFFVLCSSTRTREQQQLGLDRSDQRFDEQQRIDDGRSADMNHLSAVRSELAAGAASGNDTAMASLAMLLLLGDASTPVDTAAGCQWAKRAAASGNPRGHALHAFCLSTGRTDQGDSFAQTRATLHFTMASMAGDAYGMMASAHRLAFGRSAPESCDRAASAYAQLSADVAAAMDEWNFVSVTTPYARLAESAEWPDSAEMSDHDIISYYEYLADTGDVRALATLGHLHATGAYGVGVDHEAAREYYEAAAEGGDASGEAGLGYLHERGLGVPQDNATALDLYRKAAAKNNPIAITRLGQLHLRGAIVNRDPTKAFQFFDRAAKLGWPQAHVHLGDMYRDGVPGVVSRDIGKAMRYYAAAASAHNFAAMHELALLLLDPGSGSSSSSCKTALDYLRKVAQAGPWVSELMAEAEAFFDESEYEKALSRFELVAELGLEEAQANAAWMHERGMPDGFNGAPPGPRHEAALRYWKQSAEQSLRSLAEVGKVKIGEDTFSGYSVVKLGDYHYYGLGGLPVNPQNAAKLYEEVHAANAQAAFNLGVMHQFGTGVPQDLHLAKRFYDIAGQHPNTGIAVWAALAGIGLHHAWFYALSNPDIIAMVFLAVVAVLIAFIRFFRPR